MSIRVWRSGDRKTVWMKTLRQIHPDGTEETWTVEKISVLHPKTQQVAKVRSGQLVTMRVFPASKQFYDRRTGALVKHTSYYTFSQSFMGGYGSSRDKLGGFATGQFMEVYDKAYRRNMLELRKRGFVLVK